MSVTPKVGGSLTAGWKNWPPNDGTYVERGTDGVTFARVATVASGVNSYIDNGLAVGTYYYRVQAFNSVGVSAYSNVASGTVTTSDGGGTGGGGKGGGGSTCPSQSISAGELTVQARGNEGAAAYPPPPIVGVQTQCENGISLLMSSLAPSVNPIVSPAAVLDLEHQISANAQGDSFSKTGQFIDWFTPRFGVYTITRIDASTVRIVRLPQDDPHGLGYEVTYHIVSPNIVDMTYKVTPTDVSWLITPYGHYLLTFVASYTAPLATPLGVFFYGPSGWQWFNFPVINDHTNNGSAYGAGIRPYGSLPLTWNPATTSPWNYFSYNTPDMQYVQPTMVQQFPGGMELQWIFDRSESTIDRIVLVGMKWFTNRLPADFAHVVFNPQSGQTYGYRARLIFEPSSDSAHWTQNLLDAQALWAQSAWPQ